MVGTVSVALDFKGVGEQLPALEPHCVGAVAGGRKARLIRLLLLLLLFLLWRLALFCTAVAAIVASLVCSRLAALLCTAAGLGRRRIGQKLFPILDQRLGQTYNLLIFATLAQIVHSHAYSRLGQYVQINVQPLQCLQQVQSLLLTLKIAKQTFFGLKTSRRRR